MTEQAPEMGTPSKITRRPNGGILVEMPDGKPAGKPTARGLGRYLIVIGDSGSSGRWVEKSGADLSSIRRARRRFAHLGAVILDRETGSLVR